ncbi:MAG: hypothetical protein WCS52_08570 [bacterium]
MSPATTDWDEVAKPASPHNDRPPPRAAGCLIVTGLSAAIVIALAVFGIQTKVGSDLVANSLKKQTGLDLSVGGAQLVAPLDLVLTDVQTKPSTTPLGNFKVREIQIGWRWGGEWHLVLRGLRLELVKIADGWVPAPFARLAVLADVRDTVALLAEDPKLVSLDITDSGVVWSTPDGERLSAVDGLSLSMRPVSLGERQVRLFEVSARSVFRTGGVKGRLLRRMWVTTQESPYLEVDYRGVWEGDDSTVRDWWSIPAEPGKQGKTK